MNTILTQNRQLLLIPFLGILFVSLIGCASVSITGFNKHVDVPILLNDRLDKDYKVVGHVQKTFSYWWFAWGAFNMNHIDLIDLVKNDVHRLKGDALINLKVEGKTELADGIFSILTTGLFFGRTYTVSGEIVQYNN